MYSGSRMFTRYAMGVGCVQLEHGVYSAVQ